ncbi:MAG: flagellar hook-basal body complex protein, partial [Pseudomonadota bacterium]
MRTGVSGMDAQSSRLSAVADNIANDTTAGYKRATTEFSSLVLDNHGANYSSGGVESSTRYEIDSQGVLSSSNSATDLAISGNGFFLVSNEVGDIRLTRAGAFVPDATGRLVNGAGYYLMGYNAGTTGVANGTGGLEQINLNDA